MLSERPARRVRGARADQGHAASVRLASVQLTNPHWRGPIEPYYVHLKARTADLLQAMAALLQTALPNAASPVLAAPAGRPT